MAAAVNPSTDLDVPTMTPGARRIMEVASELFYRHGIHAVGVDTIAAESGMTKRTLYDRFGSKENLVAVYLRARHRQWWARLDERLADAPAPRVLGVFDAYLYDGLPSDRGCAFLNAAGELPTDHPAYRVVRAHKQAVRRRVGELLRADLPGIGDAGTDGGDRGDAGNGDGATARDGRDAVETTADELFLLLEGGIAHRGVDGDDRLLAVARTAAERLLRRGDGPAS